MVSRKALHSGMTVRSVHGERLGHILALGDAQFCIEKGLFFKKGYFASYEEVKEVRDGEVILSHGRERLLGHDGAAGNVVHELQTVRVPRVDQEIEATPVNALPLSQSLDVEARAVGQVSRRAGSSEPERDERDPHDNAYTPTPVRPLKEGGALPPSPGPDGLGVG